MNSISDGLGFIFGALVAIWAVLLFVVNVLSSSVAQQKRTNDISERMAKIMEGA